MDQLGFLLEYIRMCPSPLYKLVLITRYRLHSFVWPRSNSEHSRLDLNLLYILKEDVLTYELMPLTMHCWIPWFLSGICYLCCRIIHTLHVTVRGVQPRCFLFLHMFCFWRYLLTPGLSRGGRWFFEDTERHTHSSCSPSPAPIIELNK